MKKLLLSLLLLPAFGFCDTKISALPSTTTLNSVDIIPVVTNPSTAPGNFTITKANLISTLGITSGGSSIYPATATASFPFGFTASTTTISTQTVSGEIILQDGTIIKSTSTLGGGSTSPGGSTSQVQYNLSGSFTGSSNFTTDGSSVTVSTAVAIGKIYTPTISNAPNSTWNLELYNGLSNDNALSVTDNYINGTILKFGSNSNAQPSLQGVNGMGNGYGASNTATSWVEVGQFDSGLNATIGADVIASTTSKYAFSVGIYPSTRNLLYISTAGLMNVIGSGGLGVTYGATFGSMTVLNSPASSAALIQDNVKPFLVLNQNQGNTPQGEVDFETLRSTDVYLIDDGTGFHIGVSTQTSANLPIDRIVVVRGSIPEVRLNPNNSGLTIAPSGSTMFSSFTVVNAAGMTDAYNLNIGSMTGAGLSSCSGGSNALTWSSSTNQFGCNTISGSGGGASTLGVANGQVLISSPTALISMDSNTLSVALQGGATAYVTINTSSITAQGNTFNGNTQLVQTNGSGQLPAISGALLTNLTAANILAGNLGSSVVGSSLAVNSVYPAAVTSAVYGNITGVGSQSQALNMNTHLIDNVVDPASAQDAATKNYVDQAVVNAIAYKEAARLATAAALPTNTYNNGTSGVGATLTGISLAALTVDGAVTIAGDRVLVKNEALPANNGIYTVTVVGSVGAAYVLTRSVDFNQSADIDAGDALFITSGTVNTNTGWVFITTGTITVGTSPMVFAQFSGPGAIAFQANGVALTSQAIINFQNGSASNGLTVNASNPTQGNVQMALSGNLSLTTGASGVLQAAQEPAHTGDVTNSASSLAMTAASTQANIKTFTSPITDTSSHTVVGSGGLGVTYNVNVGSMTGAGLSTCGDTSHALAWSSTNNLFTCQSITGGGGGSPTGSNFNVQTSSNGAFGGAGDFNVFPSSIVAGPTYEVHVSTLAVDGGSMTVNNVGNLTLNNATFTVNVATNIVIQDAGSNFIVYPSTGYVLTVSSSIASTSLINIPGFAFVVGPSETWSYECHLDVTGATGGSEYGINGPSGATTDNIIFADLASATAITTMRVNALNTASAALATNAAAIMIQITGEMTTSTTAGTWTLMRKGVTSPNLNALNAGSYCVARRQL